ncbi:MAG: N-acetyl-gamma-glutamyl-phosphate reductase [Rickettsiales bacterium]
MRDKINITIIGASGYTGAELIRILSTHANANIVNLTADSQAGKHISEVYPHLHFKNLPKLISIDEVDFSGTDLVFCCLPHGTTQSVISSLPKNLKIIDLSADFRLHDTDTYAQWYGHKHKAMELQKEAVYGLCEHNRDKIKNSHLIANPGCYPTTSSLPLIPLLSSKMISENGIIIDAKSGVTGAGRSVTQANLYSETNEGIKAYGVGGHRHLPEIEQNLSIAAGSDISVTFTPHLMPMNRGILSTIYVNLSDGITINDIRKKLHNSYDSEYFVHVLPEGVLPSTSQVRGTNDCMINIFPDRIKNRAIIVSVTDNLMKGASGQAVQNMNIMFGLSEKTGLEFSAIFP